MITFLISTENLKGFVASTEPPGKGHFHSREDKALQTFVSVGHHFLLLKRVNCNRRPTAKIDEKHPSSSLEGSVSRDALLLRFSLNLPRRYICEEDVLSAFGSGSRSQCRRPLSGLSSEPEQVSPPLLPPRGALWRAFLFNRR